MRYQELFEARAMINGRPVLLLKNPTASVALFHIEGFRQGIARGTLIYNDLYLFDAYLATHAEIEEFFGVPISNMGFDIADHGGSFVAAAPDAAWPMLVANPNVIRLLGDPRLMIATEDGKKTLADFQTSIDKS